MNTEEINEQQGASKAKIKQKIETSLEEETRTEMVTPETSTKTHTKREVKKKVKVTQDQKKAADRAEEKEKNNARTATTNRIDAELFNKMRVIGSNHRVKKDDLVEAIFNRYINKYELVHGPIKERSLDTTQASEIMD